MLEPAERTDAGIKTRMPVTLLACHACTFQPPFMCRLLGRGNLQFPLDGKPCLTQYEVLGHTRSARHNWITTVKLRPHTGTPRLTLSDFQRALSLPRDHRALNSVELSLCDIVID